MLGSQFLWIKFFRKLYPKIPQKIVLFLKEDSNIYIVLNN